MTNGCAQCGMLVGDGPRYHPYAACLMMKAARNGTTVEVNLRAVVAYGITAGKTGVTLDQAMTNIALAREKTG